MDIISNIVQSKMDGNCLSESREIIVSVPHGWRVTTLGELIYSCSSGMTPSRTRPDFFRGDIRWITSGELNYNVITDTKEKISQEAVKRTHLKILSVGTFLMAITGLEAEGTRGSCGIVGAPSTTNQSCMAIIPTEELSSQYLFYYYVFQGKDLALKFCQGTKQQSYTAKLVRKLPIILPIDIAEQHAIAAALSDADGLIGALDALIAKKRDMKQAAMQQLLTGRTRLPGFEGEWEEKRLGEVASIRNQKVLPSNVDQDTLCLELEHIGQGDGRLLDFGIASDSTSTKYRFFNGDVLFGRLRSYLRKFWHADRAGICTTEIWPLMADGSRINSGFLYAAVQSDRFVEAASISYGTHMPRADWGVMKNFEICLPPLHEQIAIATVLSDMDAEIAALERRRDKAKEIKQGMMQQLLTGKVRLVSPEEMGEHNNNMVQA